MKNALILFGGVSSEHYVSLVSASYVIRNVPADEYRIYMLGITLDGEWYLYDGDVELLPKDKWLESGKIRKAVISPDRQDSGIIVLDGDKCEKIKIDVAFPVLHGANGEDGTVQGLLELSGIPYVGSGVLASSCCMDKAVTNTVADTAGVPQAKWLSVIENDYRKSKDAFLNKAIDYLNFPIFVKPANAGSSVGISKAGDIKALADALEIAFKEDKKAVLESFVDGYEVECAVLGNYDAKAMSVGQIKPANEFYDYEAKYENSASELYIPAKITDAQTEEVKKLAVKVYKALGCAGLSRVDFFVGKNDGKVYFNEINTLPGFTPISMYPKLCEHSGIEYKELIGRLFELALEKKNDR
ncbi:MAG: D-alanine--D-alanine ligase [Ruminococcaceae bacterium]|nr:D-alanine--D-alanine ligase [Oscillospiraceae bacterium]